MNISEMWQVITNAMTSRIDFIKRMTDPRRNIAKECGHPEEDECIDIEKYSRMYSRNPVAARVVEVLPKQSWQVQPVVYENEEAEVRTRFERVWKQIPRQLWGEKCYYQDEDGNPLWEFLQRADELSGIGRYGIILIGIDDGRGLHEPIKGMEDADPTQPPRLDLPDIDMNGLARGGYFYSYNEAAPKFTLPPDRLEEPLTEDANKDDIGKGLNHLTFLRALSEEMVVIHSLETNEKSPRYGQPKFYQIQLSEPGDDNFAKVGAPTNSKLVHWSRVIHIADNLKTSQVYGIPRMQQVYDELLDCKKVASGAAEMYWKGAFPGLSLESHPQLGDGIELDEEKTKEMMEAYSNGLQRWIALLGMSAKSLAPQVVDPTPQVMMLIMLICIKIGVPKRKFMGSEKGEMASSDDDASWNDELRSRQKGYVSPRIIRPFVNRLIAANVLPKPKGFSIYWPDLSSQTTQEKATTAVALTQALVQYVQGKLYLIMTPLDFFVTVLKMTEAEAIATLKRAKKQMPEWDKLFEKLDPPAPEPGNPTVPKGGKKKLDPVNAPKPDTKG